MGWRASGEVSALCNYSQLPLCGSWNLGYVIAGLALLNKTVVTEIRTHWNCAKWRSPGGGVAFGKKNWTTLGSDLKMCHLFTQSFKHTFIQHLVGTRWVPSAELCTEETGMSKIYIRWCFIRQDSGSNVSERPGSSTVLWSELSHPSWLGLGIKVL